VLVVLLVGCGNTSTGAGHGTGGAPPAGGGSTAVGGSHGTGGVSATGGSATGTGAGATTGTGGAASATGGATTGAGGATTSTGGATTGAGGATTSAGGTTSGTGGATTGRGGATTGTGGTTVGTGGVTVGTGGATTGQGGTTGGQGGNSTGAGGATTGTGGSTTLAPNAIYAAPNGSASAAGSIDNPTTLANAVTKVSAGGTIYLRGGTYALSSTVSLSKSGSASSPINLLAYPLDSNRPLLDFSTQATGSRGVSLSGSYWRVYGIDILSAGDNCMFVSGSSNTLEYLTFSECEDSGLQLGNGAANNVVLNCDSYFNADATLENADGFAAKLDVGSGNKFVGCRAWNNLDDGWDGYLRGADNVSTSYEDCWAIDNGKLKNGSVGVGDGNGFKTGGSDDKTLRHNATYLRCIAAGNVHDGFDHNSNRGSVTIRNCAAHNNGSNINFSATNIAASLTIKNTISLGTNGELNATTKDITNNSWQNGLSATNADFVSVDTALLKSKRKSDGSLPDIDYFKLVSGSDLRNAGVDVGLPYSGPAPDLGPFESSE
jgi:hypothetical protein